MTENRKLKKSTRKLARQLDIPYAVALRRIMESRAASGLTNSAAAEDDEEESRDY